jgi:hypothetical protein
MRPKRRAWIENYPSFRNGFIHLFSASAGPGITGLVAAGKEVYPPFSMFVAEMFIELSAEN